MTLWKRKRLQKIGCAVLYCALLAAVFAFMELYWERCPGRCLRCGSERMEAFDPDMWRGVYRCRDCKTIYFAPGFGRK